MLDLQELVRIQGIRRDAVGNLFHESGRDLTQEDWEALYSTFLANHPDWTRDELEEVDIASLTELGEGV